MRKRREAPPAGFEPEAAVSTPSPAPEPRGAPPTQSNGPSPEVAKTSEQLQDELDKNARAELRKGIEFERPNNAPQKESPLDVEFDRIATTLIVEHPMEIYQKLEAALKVGDQRTDHGSVNKSLDEAESNCRLAHRLWSSAKLEYERWRLDNNQVFGAMWLEATVVLQKEKDAKLRNKQITDADVESMCSSLFPEQWRAQEIKRKKVELMVKSMENLTECWISRCRSLQAMLSKQR
jgi:hypothetical protein